MAEKIIFLDRDGVINWDPIGDYIKHPDDFRFLEGSDKALKKFSNAGFKIVIISNQAGVGDGVFSEEDLKKVNDKFMDESKKIGVNIDHVYYCLHGKRAGCGCRKPETGLFEIAEKEIGNFKKTEAYYVGDKSSDIEAGKRFGLQAVFVLTGHGSNEKEKLKEEYYPDKILDNLNEAADFIISETK